MHEFKIRLDVSKYKDITPTTTLPQYLLLELVKKIRCYNIKRTHML